MLVELIMYVVARRAGTIKTLASWLSRYEDRLHHIAFIIVTTTSFEKSQMCVHTYPKHKGNHLKQKANEM